MAPRSPIAWTIPARSGWDSRKWLPTKAIAASTSVSMLPMGPAPQVRSSVDCVPWRILLRASRRMQRSLRGFNCRALDRFAPMRRRGELNTSCIGSIGKRRIALCEGKPAEHREFEVAMIVMSYFTDADNMVASEIRVILADDHPMMLIGIEHEFADVNSIRLVGTARNSTELIALLTSTQCDVLVSDYAMPA